MPGTLFVVSTPIGNLEDITVRALRVLREVAVIGAEDTRRTARLLAHYAISTPTVSFHEHNTRARVPQLLARLEGGEHVAIVSDAGTPGISDPGLELVQGCIQRGILVDPVPGASAPLTALVASGFPLAPVTILGFPPPRAIARREWLAAQVATVPHTVVLFESPHRVVQTLKEMGLLLGDRPITVGRELTKVHQEFLRGSASAVLAELREPRGEFTLVVGPNSTDKSATPQASDDELLVEFGRLTDSGRVGRREAITQLAKRFARTARDVYASIERAKSADGPK